MVELAWPSSSETTGSGWPASISLVAAVWRKVCGWASVAPSPLIETEASERIGAGRYERVESRVTERNGSRPRLLATQTGDVELKIPKLRKGSFFPVILEGKRS